MQRIELSEEDCRELDKIRKPGESYLDALRGLLDSVRIVEDVAAEGGVQHLYGNE